MSLINVESFDWAAEINNDNLNNYDFKTETIIFDVETLKHLLNSIYDNIKFGRLFWKKIDNEMIRIFKENTNLLISTINNYFVSINEISFENLLEIFEIVIDNMRLERKDFKILDEELKLFNDIKKDEICNSFKNYLKSRRNKKQTEAVSLSNITTKSTRIPDINENKEEYYLCIDIGYNKYYYIPRNNEVRYNATEDVFIIIYQKYENGCNYFRVKDMTNWFAINENKTIKYKDFGRKYKFLNLEILKVEDKSKDMTIGN